MTTAAEHVRAALAALTSDRDTINRQIKVLQRTLGELEGAATEEGGVELAEPGAVAAETPAVPPRPVSEVVGALLRERDVVSMTEIMDALRLEGNTAQPQSVSSILSRMVSHGLIEKGPRRGTFTNIAPPTQEDAEHLVDEVSHDVRSAVFDQAPLLGGAPG